MVLVCKLTKGALDTKWYKDGCEIKQQTGKYYPFVLDDEQSAYLEIYNVDEKDVGDYILVLPNNEHSAPAHVRLEVKPKLEISKEFKNRDEIILNAGNNFSFEVKFKINK